MSLLLILLILFIILIIIVYYLYFLENYIYIKHNLLEEDDIRVLHKELKNIQEDRKDEFKHEDYKKYLLLDSTKHKKIYDIIYKNDFLKNKIKNDFNIDLQYPKHPIEYRIYNNDIELIAMAKLDAVMLEVSTETGCIDYPGQLRIASWFGNKYGPQSDS